MQLVDAVVVGAGPVGLLTAVELTLGGARVLVLERLDAPADSTKALGFGPLGAEALLRRGMGGPMDEAAAHNLAALAALTHISEQTTPPSSVVGQLHKVSPTSSGKISETRT